MAEAEAKAERMRKEQLGIQMVAGAEIVPRAPDGAVGAAEAVGSLGQKCVDREIASHSP